MNDERNYQLQSSCTRYYDGLHAGRGSNYGPNRRRNFKTLESAIKAAKAELKRNDLPKVARVEEESYIDEAGRRQRMLRCFAEDGHEFDYGEDYEFWHVDSIAIVDRTTQKTIWEAWEGDIMATATLGWHKVYDIEVYVDEHGHVRRGYSDRCGYIDFYRDNGYGNYRMEGVSLAAFRKAYKDGRVTMATQRGTLWADPMREEIEATQGRLGDVMAEELGQGPETRDQERGRELEDRQ